MHWDKKKTQNVYPSPFIQLFIYKFIVTVFLGSFIQLIIYKFSIVTLFFGITDVFNGVF